ncbi:MAG TPA: adenylate/guanylate cyclase domain-containing protein [Acidimicrobiia bacterium]
MMTASATTLSGAIAFCDIVGFTELTADHGDEVALALVEQHENLTRALLPDGARIVKQLGDGLLLFFGEAAGAVDALVRLHTDTRSATVGDVPLWIRTGLHWGSPRVRGDDLIGHDVNLASRVVALAAPGELLVTDAYVGACPSVRERLVELGPVFVKGVSDPIGVWRLRDELPQFDEL